MVNDPTVENIKCLQEEMKNSYCDYSNNIKQTVAYYANLCMNFSKYWFKVYKPFEEFDTTDTAQGDNILQIPINQTQCIMLIYSLSLIASVFRTNYITDKKIM